MMREILGGNGVDGAVFLDATEVYRKRGHEERFQNGRLPDYREKLGAELKELHDSEMWSAGRTVRGLRPENQ
jgi:hypothetical protein